MSGDSNLYPSIHLFPNRFRYIGGFLILCSLAAAYLYFWGGRPALFEIPVFALVTSYAETRWMTIAQTNALDEIAVIAGITGLLFIAFSKEAQETESVAVNRIRTLFYAVYTTAALVIFLYLVVFGWPIISLTAFAFVLFLLIYIILFRTFLAKEKYISGQLKNSSTFKSYSHEI